MPDTSTLDIAIQSTTRPHGASFPLGATIYPGGVNFSVFSKHATGVCTCTRQWPDSTYVVRPRSVVLLIAVAS